MDRGSNPKLNERTYDPIDLSDLIEAEQLKTVESLSESIEGYQARIVAQLVEPGGGWAVFSHILKVFIRNWKRNREFKCLNLRSSDDKWC
jgi:hypothetical protein